MAEVTRAEIDDMERRMEAMRLETSGAISALLMLVEDLYVEKINAGGKDPVAEIANIKTSFDIGFAGPKYSDKPFGSDVDAIHQHALQKIDHFLGHLAGRIQWK